MILVPMLIRLVLLLPAAWCPSSTFVCTGQGLVCAHVVLWCTSGLVSMKKFSIFPSDTVLAYFSSICVHFLLGHVFLQPEPTLARFV